MFFLQICVFRSRKHRTHTPTRRKKNIAKHTKTTKHTTTAEFLSHALLLVWLADFRLNALTRPSLSGGGFPEFVTKQ
jgi:hypothetical protein